jgi:hypothetical protein
MKKKIKLGEMYRDKYTGYTGIAFARTKYLTGCVHIGLQRPVDANGEIPKLEFFDKCRLEKP